MDVTFTLQEINTAAAYCLDIIKARKVIAFHGPMGAGKTTFIHALCTVLRVTDTTSSPTFSIINEYRTHDGVIIYHIDLYRVKDEAEAISAGVEDCLYSGRLCFVEWPEKAEGLFPPDTVHCYLNSVDNYERKLQINL